MPSTELSDAITLLIDVVFGTFHASMAWFLAAQRFRNEASYMGPFYAFQILITVVDILYVVDVALMQGLSFVPFMKDVYMADGLLVQFFWIWMF